MPAVALKVAETISSDSGIRMDDDSITDSDALADDDIRPQHAITSDGCAGPNVHARINLCPGADRRAGPYISVGADRRTLDNGFGTDDCRWMDAGRNAVGRRRQVFEYLAECPVGVGHMYHGVVRWQRALFRHQQNTGLRL